MKRPNGDEKGQKKTETHRSRDPAFSVHPLCSLCLCDLRKLRKQPPRNKEQRRCAGGQTAIDKLKSRSAKGTVTQANGNSFQFELSQAAPDKFYLLVTTPQGTRERGFNGQVGWEKTAGGVREITGAELISFKAANGLFSLLKLKEQYSRPPTRIRKDKLGDRDVYILDGTTTDNRRMRLFFDATSALLLRRTTTMPTIVGIIPDQIDLEDYREADGLKFPFTARTAVLEVGNPTSTRTFGEVKLNVPVDESKFNMPPAAKPANP